MRRKEAPAWTAASAYLAALREVAEELAPKIKSPEKKRPWPYTVLRGGCRLYRLPKAG
jgi:hypothetical protein